MGNDLIHSLVGTGATYSVLNSQLIKKSSAVLFVTGMIKQLQKQAFPQPLDASFGVKQLHSVLYLRDCPILDWVKIYFVNCSINNFSPEEQQLCLGVPLGQDDQLQVLLTCLERPRGKSFLPEIDEQVS